MFDIGFWELALIGILALVVLGPKRLPEAARAAGYWLGRVRNFIANAKSELDQHMQGGDMEEIRRLKEELDETRRYIQQVADKTGSDIASSLETIDSGFESENSIGALEKKPARKPKRKKTGKKAAKKATKKAPKKPAARKTVGKKTAGRKPKTANKKTGRKKTG